MRIAQISDLHIMLPGKFALGGADTSRHLATCIHHLCELDPAPDLIVASGDLTDHGDEAEYRRLRELLMPLSQRLSAPLFVMPGNHDSRAALRAVFNHQADHAYLHQQARKIYFSFKNKYLNFVMLDTVIAGAAHGELDTAQLAWLDQQLHDAQNSNVVIFMHHPPVAIGLPCMDEIALEPGSVRELGRIVRGHPQIVQICCGHAHRAASVRWAGTLVTICPSTAFQARPLFNDGDFAASDGELPAYQLHLWQSGSLVTHTISVAV